MQLQPYYLIPQLIEQPTWGGEYIADFKQITEPAVTGTKIGQSFELVGESLLVSHLPAQPTFSLAAPTDLKNPQFFHQTETPVSLQDFINQDPVGVLGQTAVDRYGAKMAILIKFTQAKSNSYQCHVKPGAEFDHWQPKPESWYYFEPGLVTLGLKPNCPIAEYQQRCLDIERFAQGISQDIKGQKITLAEGKQKLAEYINQDHPKRFVNFVLIEKGQVVDLSGCGIHHSWEIDERTPNGNILYEVQLDVKDDNCTLRSFDQGSIKDDGSIRPIHINSYFKALDTSPAYNQPERFFQTSATQEEGTTRITKLFDNQYYTTSLLELEGEYTGAATQTETSFHHLFVKAGQVEVRVAGMPDQVWPLTKGWSLFIPASVKQYTLRSQGSTQVLTTSV